MSRMTFDEEMDALEEKMARKQEKRGQRRAGEGVIVFLLVVGLACAIIGIASGSNSLAGGGLAPLIVGLIALIGSKNNNATRAHVWQCSSCGYIFETEGGKNRRSIVMTCPRCKNHVPCNALRR